MPLHNGRYAADVNGGNNGDGSWLNMTTDADHDGVPDGLDPCPDDIGIDGITDTFGVNFWHQSWAAVVPKQPSDLWYVVSFVVAVGVWLFYVATPEKLAIDTVYERRRLRQMLSEMYLCLDEYKKTKASRQV